MKQSTDLNALLEVSEVHYNRQREALSRLLQQEAGLRLELARLAEMGSANVQGDGAVTGIQVIGADLLWNGWLARAKTQTNIHLAQVLAQKQYEQAKVRKAFGKVTALRQIIQDEAKSAKKAAAKAALDKVIAQSVNNTGF